MRVIPYFAACIFLTNYACATTEATFFVQGEIKASTCKATVENNGLIALPKKARKLLLVPGDRTGKTSFKVVLSKCASNSVVYFEKGQQSISQGGRLLNMAPVGIGGSATNVELEILNASGVSMDLTADNGSGQNTSDADVSSVDDERIFNFYVQYYAVGAATVGKVESSVTFVVESL